MGLDGIDGSLELEPHLMFPCIHVRPDFGLDLGFTPCETQDSPVLTLDMLVLIWDLLDLTWGTMTWDLTQDLLNLIWDLTCLTA